MSHCSTRASRVWAGAFVAVAAVGCGGGVHQHSARALSVEVAVESTPVTAFALQNPKHVTYARPRDLAQLPGYERWLKGLKEPMQQLGKVKETCGIDPFEHAEELMLTKSDDSMLLAVRITVAPERALGCVEKLGGDEAERVEIAGRTAVRVDGLTAVTADDVLVLGNEEAVTSALEVVAEHDGAVARWLPDLRRTLRFQMVGMGGVGGLRALSTKLTQEATGDVELSVDFHADSALHADLVTGAIRSSLEREMKVVLGDVPRGIRDNLAQEWEHATVRRRVEGRCEVTLPIDLETSHNEAYEALGERITLAVLRNHATYQARAALHRLAENLKRYALDHRVQGRPTFLSSAPLTPAKVVRGMDGDEERDVDWRHATWKKLAFSTPTAELFSYEIKTAWSRRSTVLRAVTDLDGDGERAVLELALKVNRAGDVVIGDVLQHGDRE